MVRSLLNDVNIYGGVWYNIPITDATKQKVFCKRLSALIFMSSKRYLMMRTVIMVHHA